MMEKIESEFKQHLESNRTQRFDVIVRVADDPKSRLPQVMEHGLSVRHTYSLIKAVAASGLGTSILELAEEPWVTRIEPDEEVRTMNDE